MKAIYVLLAVGMLGTASAIARNCWSLDTAAVAINYNRGDSGAYSDHIEMSGKHISTVLRYKVGEKGDFSLEKSFVWPMLRTIPNHTGGSLMRRSRLDIVPLLHINEQPVRENVERIDLDGRMIVSGTLADGVTITRSYFPSTTLPVFCERFLLTNNRKEPIRVEIPDVCYKDVTPAAIGVDGEYSIESVTTGAQTVTVAPGQSLEFGLYTSARRSADPVIDVDIPVEEGARQDLVKSLTSSLVLETPDSILNRMFAFSKIRACESIYATKGGPMHGPGGESYYAAIWANDQAEYANPFFPFTGYEYADSSALNSFRHFARWMNTDWRPIPSSIIAEGIDYWNGAGDRGDMAMIAYGASRYALAKGDRKEAEELWPLIEWCLEYCNRKINDDGVVASDSDELEGRFPTGKANLCTSSLYYDALISASMLANELGKPKSISRDYAGRAKDIAKAIESYFAGPVEGYDTYAYYKGNDVLRAWICIPLTMGLYDRAEATADALFSPRLWTGNGLLTQAGTTTYWDRSTLYALRGVIASGAVDRALPYLQSYSDTRLLGEHVPYAIEAWPEGSQRHLSAESALYARIFTEGLFGIRPTGLRSFDLTPQLPSGWNEMLLKHIKAFAHDFDIEVKRMGDDKISIKVSDANGSIFNRVAKNCSTVRVAFKK